VGGDQEPDLNGGRLVEDSNGKQVMTAQEAADYLRINRTTLYRLAAKGVVPGARIGSKWRFKMLLEKSPPCTWAGSQ